MNGEHILDGRYENRFSIISPLLECMVGRPNTRYIQEIVKYLACGFYGKIHISIQNGKVTHVTVEENLKYAD